MAISKKMKKILAGFYELCHKYEEAYENGNRRTAMFYAEQFINYCFKFQKELKISDEYMKDWKEHFERHKAEVRKEQLLEENLIAIRAHKKRLFQEDHELVLKYDAKGLITWH
ncbi:MAG: hypothetical protein LUM44_20090 [Pyrinomonadaceae bacterium]|nr:hypothetical protein [Pyrinomonadaceae bacterium]